MLKRPSSQHNIFVFSGRPHEERLRGADGGDFVEEAVEAVRVEPLEQRGRLDERERHVREAGHAFALQAARAHERLARLVQCGPLGGRRRRGR